RHGTGTGAGATANQPPWLQALLPPLEALLTRQIGPMAKLLLRKIAATSPDFDSLGRQLLEHIPSPSAKAQFEQQMAAIGAEYLPATGTGAGSLTSKNVAGTMPPSEPSELASATDAPPPLTPEFATAVTPVLAIFIGPIAAIVVKRALRTAANRDDFLAQLAAHIDADAARQRFVEQTRRLTTP
ncbi:MAG TPA: hypothetical protein VN089_00955, partial [Duganella sp.]|nr:hypothetical protein [Duganella sp.]